VKIRLPLLVDEQILIFDSVDLDFSVDLKSSSSVLSISFLELDFGLVAHIHSESYREESKHRKEKEQHSTMASMQCSNKDDDMTS
jgi:hypothetical protein